MGYKWIIGSTLVLGAGAAITIYLWRRKRKHKYTSFSDIEYRAPPKTTHKSGNIDIDQKRKIRKLSTRTRNALRQNSSGSMKISTPGILPIIQDEDYDIIVSENEFIEDDTVSTTIQTSGYTHDHDEHLKSFISCCNVFIGYIDIYSYYDKTCIETKTETDNFRESTLNVDDNDGGVKETKQLYEITTESANREGKNTKLVRVSSIQNKSYEIMRRRHRYLWGGECHYGNKDSRYKIDIINNININKLVKDTSRSRKTGDMTNSTKNKMDEWSKTQELIAMWQARFRRTSESLSRSQSTRTTEKHVNNNVKKCPKENQSIHIENSKRKTSESRREQLRSSNALMTSFDLDDSDLEEGFSSDCSVFISNSEKEALVCDYDVIYRRNSVQERLWEIRQRRRPKRQTRACSWNMA